MAAVSALGVHEESLFRNPDLIPYPEPPPSLVQNLSHVEEEDN